MDPLRHYICDFLPVAAVLAHGNQLALTEDTLTKGTELHLQAVRDCIVEPPHEGRDHGQGRAEIHGADLIEVLDILDQHLEDHEELKEKFRLQTFLNDYHTCLIEEKS